MSGTWLIYKSLISCSTFHRPLFFLTTHDIKERMHDWKKSQFKDEKSTSKRVSRRSNCKNFQKQTMTNGIQPFPEGQNAGDCAVMKKRYSFVKRNYNCLKSYNFHCEYHSVMWTSSFGWINHQFCIQLWDSQFYANYQLTLNYYFLHSDDLQLTHCGCSVITNGHSRFLYKNIAVRRLCIISVKLRCTRRA